MKTCLLILVWLCAALSGVAQTNAPVRLAIVSETREATTLADLLTASFSSNPDIQLLERDEIAKVYHEQSLSAGNTDFLKVGRLLGADGLVLLETTRGTTNRSLNVRLVAVKPGVVVIAETFPWPLPDVTEWPATLAKYLETFLPKLTVAAGDALPISVVNLRSAVNSPATVDTERQLKLLTIQRLTREPQLFVLERQQLGMLGNEKDLSADDSAFWNGHYLLEGVVDQNGYSPDTITIDAILTPPQGAAPVRFQVAGARTNLPAVVNQLGLQVDAALKVSTSIKQWRTVDEAAQFYDEGRWALRWGLLREAQAAANSAWALGKCDRDCASLILRSYLKELSDNVGGFSRSQIEAPTNMDPVIAVQGFLRNHPLAQLNKLVPDGDNQIIYCVAPDKLPRAGNIESAIQLLQLYRSYCQNLPDAEPKATHGASVPDWQWAQLGIQDLVVASRVLQNFDYLPGLQAPVADQLAELRRQARATAELFEQSPSVHDSYFTGDHLATSENLAQIQGDGSIFSCEAKWGHFWQDRPEDGVAMYRHLLSSPVFRYLHEELWNPDLPMPRLTGWNAADRERLPAVWRSFLEELRESTNVLWQMEAKAFVMADAPTENQASTARQELLGIIRAHRAELVLNPVEIFFQNWGLGLQEPELEAMDAEYWDTTYRGNTPQGHLAAFEKQKTYLKNLTPYNFQEFVKIFNYVDYTREQAAELLPLLAAYQTNLLVKAQAGSRMDQIEARGANQWVDISVARKAAAIANPPALAPAPPANSVAAKPAVVDIPAVVQPPPGMHPPTALEVISNVLPVKTFLAIPLDRLSDRPIGSATIAGHGWFDGKLLVDIEYSPTKHFYPQSANGTAIAILDPATERWEVIPCVRAEPQNQNDFYHRSALWHGELYTSDGGTISHYDRAAGQWRDLGIPGAGNCHLFVVQDHLYAANDEVMFEVLPAGTTRLLASTRRHPAVNSLDAQMMLGWPVLFAGPGGEMRVTSYNRIFAPLGDDWHELAAEPDSKMAPVISPDGVLFVMEQMNQLGRLDWLPTEASQPSLALVEMPGAGSHGTFHRPEGKPLWQLPPGVFLANMAATLHAQNLYLLKGQKPGVEQEPGNASLLVFTHGLPRPQTVHLNFDPQAGPPPLAGIDPGTEPVFNFVPPACIFFGGDTLYLAAEISFEQNQFRFPRLEIGAKPGVWMLAKSQLDAAIAQQQQSQTAELTTTAAGEQNALAKYDTPPAGLPAPARREAALDDPAFIAAELDSMETNHQGWLDAREIAWFDANQNKILDPKELAGIEIAQHLLAVRLMKQFDSNRDGVLDQNEFLALAQASLGVSFIPLNQLMQDGDKNHDNYVDASELESFLKMQTLVSFLSSHMRGQGYFHLSGFLEEGTPEEYRQHLKNTVDFHWQHPDGFPGRTPPQTPPTSP